MEEPDCVTQVPFKPLFCSRALKVGLPQWLSKRVNMAWLFSSCAFQLKYELRELHLPHDSILVAGWTKPTARFFEFAHSQLNNI